jgi:flagellar hook-length control protein FliK
MLRALALDAAMKGGGDAKAVAAMIDGPAASTTRAGDEPGGMALSSARTTESAAAIAPSASSAPVMTMDSSHPAAAARVPVLDVDNPVGHAAWKDAVGQHVTWMVEAQVSRAELRLHPSHLGPIDVSVTLANDEVNVSFHATHPATREALESSLPRLRELLSDAGLSLGNASVSQQFAGGQRTPERPEAHASASAPRLDEQPVQIEMVRSASVRVGLLDAYA